MSNRPDFFPPQVDHKGIGVTSRSKASDVALSLATVVPAVKACVLINGFSANILVPLYYKNCQILSPLVLNHSNLFRAASGATITKYAISNPLSEENKGSLIPIEQAEGRFLFVASECDMVIDSKAHMDVMVERLKRHGKNNFESVFYQRAGHMLEPPYGPHCPSSPFGVYNIQAMWGGEPGSHAAAEVHLWKKILEFLRTHLSCDKDKSEG